MKTANKLLVGILVLGFLLRFIYIDTHPASAYGDELSFAWNAYNILKTGTDEYGTAFPLLFKAFDDYKAPIPVYLLVPFLRVFGLTTFAVRLPVVLFSVATIYFLFLLTRKLLNEKMAVIAALLLTISPWHIHLSRGYFEATIALTFFVAAIYFFLQGKEKSSYLYLSAVLFVATMYTYLTPRIVLLFFLPGLFWWSRNWLFKRKKSIVIFGLIFLVLSLPLVKASIIDQGAARIQKLTQARDARIKIAITNARNSSNSPAIMKKIFHNRISYWAREVTNDYFEHFSPQFLFLSGDSSLRYGIGNMGMLYLIELPFLLIGLYILYTKYRAQFALLIIWIVITPLPAALVGKPFAVRSLALLPGLLIITSVGLLTAWEYFRKNRTWGKMRFVVPLIFLVSLSYYLLRYHLEYPSYAATWWGWENKTALDLAFKEQDQYEQIFLSNFYTGMDLAFAYYNQTDPLVFRQARNNPIIIADNRSEIKLGKFYIGSLDLDEKRLATGVLPPKTLYIGRPEEADSDEVIRAPDDGRIIFKIYRTN